MNSKIGIEGVLKPGEETDTSKPLPTPEGPKTQGSISQVYYGQLPSTGQTSTFYFLGLGIILCLIVYVLFSLKKNGQADFEKKKT